MYLEKRTHVKNWNFMKEHDKFSVIVKRGGKAFSAIKKDRVKDIVEEIAYWRKANAIHRWFVENVQGGKDDCGDYYVSREQLQKLLDTCKEVLSASKLIDGKVANGYHFNGTERVYNMEDGKLIEDPTVAKMLLPTTEGFFFGSTDYNQWYYDDIKYTADTLEAVLKEPETEDGFYYSSSW